MCENNIFRIVQTSIVKGFCAFSLTHIDARESSLIQLWNEDHSCAAVTIIVYQTLLENYAKQATKTMQKFRSKTEERNNFVKALTEFDERTVKFFQLCLRIITDFSACLTAQKDWN